LAVIGKFSPVHTSLPAFGTTFRVTGGYLKAEASLHKRVGLLEGFSELIVISKKKADF
jgi:hypothetical protein